MLFNSSEKKEQWMNQTTWDWIPFMVLSSHSILDNPRKPLTFLFPHLWIWGRMLLWYQVNGLKLSTLQKGTMKEGIISWGKWENLCLERKTTPWQKFTDCWSQTIVLPRSPISNYYRTWEWLPTSFLATA